MAFLAVCRRMEIRSCLVAKDSFKCVTIICDLIVAQLACIEFRDNQHNETVCAVNKKCSWNETLVAKQVGIEENFRPSFPFSGTLSKISFVQ